MEVTPNKLRDVFLSSVVESMGIYPAAVIEGGKETKRTEWQDGWNAALMSINKKEIKAEEWFRSLGDDIKEMVLFLFERNALYLDVGDEIGLYVLCNDFFYPAADGEDVTIEDIPELYRLVSEYGDWGELVYASKKRDNLMPWKDEKEWYKPFYDAMKNESV
jgi:hypothetical protein